MDKPENPPAFPLAAEGPNCPHFAEGMTLRDYFAAQALAGDMASQDAAQGVYLNNIEPSVLAARAAFFYRFADAMLAERAK